MIDLITPNEWQFQDEDGTIFPWYTKPALDEIFSHDWSMKTVWEWGVGCGTIMWAKKSNFVYGVDHNPDWVQAVKNATDHQATIWYEEGFNYIHKPAVVGVEFDIMIIDGILREECVDIALMYTKKGGIIVYDNWQQISVEVQSEETQKKLLSLNHKVMPQPGHPDWNTLIVWP